MKQLEQATEAKKKPWLAPELLPTKPVGSVYGYKDRKELHPCSLEELVDACGPGGKTEVELVWHPNTERLVPVWEVPFLRDAARRRQRKHLDHCLAGAMLAFLSFILAGIKPEPGWKDFFWFNLLFLGVLPLYEWIYRVRQMRTCAGHDDSAVLEASRFGIWVQQHRVVYVWVILGVSALVTIVGFVCGLDPAIQKAGLAKTTETRFQLWRLLSGPLLHGSLPHVMCNLVSLASLGPIVEVLAGRGILACVVVSSTIAGSVFSCWFLPDKPSVGLSGGVMGLLGFVLVLGFRCRAVVPVVLPKGLLRCLLTTAFVGLAAWSVIDNAAHLGGGLAGAGVGYWLTRQPMTALPVPRNRWLELAGGAALALLVAAGAWAMCLLVR